LGIVRSGEACAFKGLFEVTLDKQRTAICIDTVPKDADHGDEIRRAGFDRVFEQAIEQFRTAARPETKKAPHALSGMEREVRGCET
jgi:hypothetical protein